MTAKEILQEKYGSDLADEATIKTTLYKMAQIMEEYSSNQPIPNAKEIWAKACQTQKDAIIHFFINEMNLNAVDAVDALDEVIDCPCPYQSVEVTDEDFTLFNEWVHTEGYIPYPYAVDYYKNGAGYSKKWLYERCKQLTQTK